MGETACEVFVDLFEPLVCCLEEMKDSNDWNRDTRADAQSHFLTLSRFPFIIALMKDVLAHTKALSTRLQGRYIDIVKAYKEVEFVKSSLKGARDGVDGFHTRVYCTALQVAAKIQVDESLPRTTGHQLHHINVLAVTVLPKRSTTKED